MQTNYLAKIESLTLTDQEVVSLIRECANCALQDPCLVRISSPCVIIGDVRANWQGFTRVYNSYILPYLQKNYTIIFQGGTGGDSKFALRTMFFIMHLKITYPKQVYLLRSYFECPSIAKIYMQTLWKKQFRNSSIAALRPFHNALPWCALIDNHAFVTTGGISKHITSMSCFDSVIRPFHESDQGLFFDLIANQMTLDNVETTDEGV